MFAPSRSHRRWLAAATLICCGLLLAPTLFHRIVDWGRATRANLRIIATTTPAERQLQVYGDRTGWGYGYLRDVTAILPEPDLFPVTRYADFTRHVDLVLPGTRRGADPRVVVGIDLHPSATEEQSLPAAKRLSITEQDGQRVEIWTFETIDDFDTFTGFRLTAPPNQITPPLTWELRSSPKDGQPLATGQFLAEALSPLITRPQQPVKEFSFQRGRTPFALVLRGPAVPTWSFTKIEPLGIKVDLTNYHILHREGRSFTAVHQDFENAWAGKPAYLSWRRDLDQIGKQPAVAEHNAGPSWRTVFVRAGLGWMLCLFLAWALGHILRWRTIKFSDRIIEGALVASYLMISTDYLLHWFGRDWRSVGPLLLGLSAIGVVAAAVRRDFPLRFPQTSPSLGKNHWPASLTLLGLAFLVIATLELAGQPVTAQDAVEIWLAKADAVAHDIFPDTQPYPNYPPLVPHWQAILSQIAGTGANLSRLIVPAFYLGWFVLLGTRLLGPPTASAGASFVILAAVMVLAAERFTLTSGYQDGSLIAVSGMAAVCWVGAWQADLGQRQPRPDIFNACVLGGSLAVIKNEGLILGMLLLICGTATYFFRRSHPPEYGLFRSYAWHRSLTVGLVTLTFWIQILNATRLDPLRVQGDAFTLQGLMETPFAPGRFAAVATQLAATARTHATLILAVLLAVVVAGSLDRLQRRALIGLSLMALLQIAFVCVVFLATQADLQWHLATAWNRLISQQAGISLTLFALAARSLWQLTQIPDLPDRDQARR